jgi:hypothetical protein
MCARAEATVRAVPPIPAAMRQGPNTGSGFGDTMTALEQSKLAVCGGERSV